MKSWSELKNGSVNEEKNIEKRLLPKDQLSTRMKEVRDIFFNEIDGFLHWTNIIEHLLCANYWQQEKV